MVQRRKEPVWRDNFVLELKGALLKGRRLQYQVSIWAKRVKGDTVN